MKTIKNFFIMLFGAIRFRVYVAKADLMHHNTGKRYFVIPHPTSRTKLLVISSDDRRRLQRAGIMSKDINWLYLMEHCLYYTCQGGKSNDTQMEKEKEKEKERMWIEHLKNRRKK